MNLNEKDPTEPWDTMRPELVWAWLSQTERRAAEQALIDAGPEAARTASVGVLHYAIRMTM